jgi:1-acyl-sn-glycerol-3-phosphate acyltransferase
MMEEKHLKKLFLFRKLGAFSVNRENPREAIKSINYAAGILNGNPNTALWIFPQGEILPNDLRPLKFYNGLAKIIQKIGRCSVTSLSMRYEFLGEFKPEVFVKVDEPEFISIDNNFKTKNFTAKLAKCATQNLDQLKYDLITENLTDYQSIL